MVSHYAEAQWIAESAVLDFGDVQDESGLLMESHFIRDTTDEGLLLRIEGDGPSIDVRVESKRIGPNERMNYRVKLLPRKTGPIRHELVFHFTDQSVPIRVRADIVNDRALSMTPCPDFGSETVQAQGTPVVLTRFNVVDEQSGKGVSKALITLVGRKGFTREVKTNARGRAQVELPLDYYLMKVVHPGYAKLDVESYINRTRDDFRFELRPGEGYVVSRIPDDTQVVESMDLDPAPSSTAKVDSNSVEQTVVDSFSLSDYRPNHLVFLVDISTSMGQSGRMEIVREQLSGLAGMLRAEDHITLITYSDQAEIRLLDTPVRTIESVKSEISELEAEGGTAGGNALKKAYAVSRRHFMEDGNNHVFLVSDGAFNKDSGRLKGMIRRHAEQDIGLSVICVKSSQWMSTKMGELAAAGGGSVLSLDTEQGSGRLRELIKRQCSR